MIKLIVFVLFIAVLFSAGIVQALAFLGALMLIVPVAILCIGAVMYISIIKNARRNSRPPFTDSW